MDGPVIPQLRLDTTNPNDNDFNVVIPPIGRLRPLRYGQIYPIPPGADVQIQDWEIWFTDASSANTGEKPESQRLFQSIRSIV